MATDGGTDAMLVARREALAAQARSVAHELGNLLTGLGLTLELLEGTALDEAQRRYVGRCLQLCGRLAGQKAVLAGLGGQLGEPHAATPTRVLIEAALGRCGRQLPNVQVAVGPGAEQVVGQKVLLEEALVQLLRNAADASPATAALSLSADAVVDPALGPCVALELADLGEGPPPQIAHLLGRAPASTKPHAAGMGLMRVSAIAEAIHGGRFALCARRPHGARAVLTLPSRR